MIDGQNLVSPGRHDFSSFKLSPLRLVRVGLVAGNRSVSRGRPAPATATAREARQRFPFIEITL
nr:Hypothetical protein SC2p1_01120 [Methylocystis sp. SC2]